MQKLEKTNFKFINPGKAKLFSDRVNENKGEVDISKKIWKWQLGGQPFLINWSKYEFIDEELLEVFKYYIFYRLENYSLSTVRNDAWMIHRFTRYLTSNKLTIELFENSLSKMKNNSAGYNLVYFSLFAFCKFCEQKSLLGITKSFINLLNKFVPEKRNPYSKIYLRQNVLSPADELLILGHLETSNFQNNFIELRDNIILQIGFELGPRSIQIFTMDITDFNVVKGSDSKFFSIELSLAKKIRSGGAPEKRTRSISNKLGVKIEEYLILREKRKFRVANIKALFVNDYGARLSTGEISKIVSLGLKKIGLKNGESLVDLRHHLAQSLADQGAPVETIAEILGHNSTVAARAYIAASPEIAEIKTRALGKNSTYLDIMKMLLTGRIIERDTYQKERWVKGLVGGQYIGGIGACGLSAATACPKNPVYSCYTCSKFHPFVDGSHNDVVIALEKQSQYFIDIADRGNQIESNRALVQLESTIEAVNSVIQNCNTKIKSNEKK